MVHGYHLILPMYGFWLPNDPRGSWSEYVRRWEPMWAAQQWKVYLDSETAIEEAIHYVESNPEKEGKPRQNWSFVTPFAGLSKGGQTTYH